MQWKKHRSNTKISTVYCSTGKQKRDPTKEVKIQKNTVEQTQNGSIKEQSSSILFNESHI